MLHGGAPDMFLRPPLTNPLGPDQGLSGYHGLPRAGQRPQPRHPTLYPSSSHTSQGLIKDLLDVPDNLERAAASVPDLDASEDTAAAAGAAAGPLDADKLRRLLKGLLEGVRATEKIMLQV